MKVKGVTIKESDLVAAISDYCDHHRIRSKTILEACGEYFIANGHLLNTPQINSIAKVYGKLNYHPPNGFKFWEKLEALLEKKFAEFPPKDLVELLMTFVYIERYPLNLVWKIFNPCFYDRVESQVESDAKLTKLGLDLLHTSIRLEKGKQHSVEYYIKRYDNYKYMEAWNNRVIGLSNALVKPLGEYFSSKYNIAFVSYFVFTIFSGNIIGDVKRIDIGVLLTGLVHHPIYRTDMMIYPSVRSSLMRFGASTYNKNSQIVVVLIHHNLHYDLKGDHLIGREVMRIRVSY